MKEIKLIALDMDGTLLNDDGIVTPYTYDVIQEALERGIHVVLSTGRPLPMCIDYYYDLKLKHYIITSNGAEIWKKPTELIAHFPMEAEKVKQLWTIGNEHGFHMWMVAREEIFPNATRPEDFTDYTWLKMGYGNLTQENKQYLLKKLRSYQRIEITNSSPRNIEINRKGVHKANAINIVCERIGITMDHVLAVGDSLNDLKMIERAGIGVAMENAQSIILAAADYVTASNNEDGVGKAIEKYALAKIR